MVNFTAKTAAASVGSALLASLLFASVVNAGVTITTPASNAVVDPAAGFNIVIDANSDGSTALLNYVDIGLVGGDLEYQLGKHVVYASGNLATGSSGAYNIGSDSLSHVAGLKEDTYTLKVYYYFDGDSTAMTATIPVSVSEAAGSSATTASSDSSSTTDSSSSTTDLDSSSSTVLQTTTSSNSVIRASSSTYPSTQKPTNAASMVGLTSKATLFGIASSVVMASAALIAFA